MLLELSLANFAVIGRLVVRFGEGLNIITGETGTGKSIIVEAVNVVLGAKASGELVKTGQSEAHVEALFSVRNNPSFQEKLDSLGYGDSEDELIIKRIIPRKGRGRVYINGSLATASVLTQISGGLIDIFSQREHQTLMREESHIAMLDEFSELGTVASSMRSKYNSWRETQERLEELERSAKTQDERGDYLRFQIKEIDEGNLEPGEDTRCEAEINKLSNAQRLHEVSFGSYNELYEEQDCVVDRLKSLCHRLTEALEFDPSLRGSLGSLESALHELEDSAFELRDYARGVVVDPDRLESAINRLDEIKRLKKKYGGSIEDVLRRRETFAEELSDIEGFEERLSELKGELESLSSELQAVAGELGEKRQKAAIGLTEMVNGEFSNIGLKNAKLHLRFEEIPVSQSGAQRVSFLFSANPDEQPKPLAKVASGGELSRIMLVLKEILTTVEGASILIFDEADSGIGGAVAETVGRKIKKLSESYQVLCITHLPLVAKFADTHICVTKTFERGRTKVGVEQLSGEERVEELARMMGGLRVTEKTIEAAREMLK
ncbi:MAG: DNA repair protein RecN [Thermodesulfobacteriota bacterium]